MREVILYRSEGWGGLSKVSVTYIPMGCVPDGGTTMLTDGGTVFVKKYEI